MADRDLGAGQELPLLVRVAVDRELEQVGADPAVVEQRVSLAGSAVAGDALAIAAALDQELEQPPLGLLDPRRERAVSLEPVEAELPLALGQLRHPRRSTGLAAFLAAVRRRRSEPPCVAQLLDVEHLEAVGGEAPFWAVRNEK